MPEPTVVVASARVAPTAAPRRRAWGRWVLGGAGGLVLAAVLVLAFGRFEYAYVPSRTKLANAERLPMPAYDVFGEEISHAAAEELLRTAAGRERLRPENGAIAIDGELLRFGRRAFYTETFDNEYFLSDVVGLLHGPVTSWSFARALLELRGSGTGNLRVRLAKDATVAGHRFRRGEYVDTGFEVPRGAWLPIGLKWTWDRGRIRAGLTCAACHVATEPASGRVLEGAPNPDLALGLLLALAPNSAAYFGRTDVDVARRGDLYSDPTRTAPTADGGVARLPDPRRLEDAVDATLLAWPPGHVDTMADLVANPVRIPDAFTRGDHPYGWNGFGAVGPFRGLSALGSAVHALSADPSIESHLAPAQFELAPEVYLAVLLQRAANRRYRYDPTRGETAVEFLARINPNGDSPGLSQTAQLPSYPHATPLVPHGVVVSRRGWPVWAHVNAISAFQQSLRPPRAAPGEIDEARFAAGRAVFVSAGCADCHSGPAFTNNRVLPAREVGTEPRRARALHRAGREFEPVPTVWAWDTPVPVPAGARALTLPIGAVAAEATERAFAQDGEGGYKVKGLVGLRWSAPYLHTGAVAVGPDAEHEAGLAGTLLRGVRPDPANSLRALLDRELRARVRAADAADPRVSTLRLDGAGHEFWVDAAAGFDAGAQAALVHYLLYLDHDPSPPLPPPAPAAQAPGPLTVGVADPTSDTRVAGAE